MRQVTTLYQLYLWLWLGGLLAGANAWATAPCAVAAPEWDTAEAAYARYQSEGDKLTEAVRHDIEADWATIKAIYDAIVNETDPLCRELRDFDTEDQRLVAWEADLSARINAHNADPNRSDEAAAALDAELAELNAALAKLHEWNADMNQRIDANNARNYAQYNAFTAKVNAALKSGFTGTKTVRMTAKSWISAELPLLTSLKGIMLRMDANDAPYGPRLDDSVDDHKLYQTFTAEAEFVNGKVVAARFLEDTLDLRTATTFGAAEGLIYVKESSISDWHERGSVTFTRTVAGSPHILLTEPIEWTMDEPFQDIWNTLSVEIKADEVSAHGYGSDFPSHSFWQDDRLMHVKQQVAPAEYFR